MRHTISFVARLLYNAVCVLGCIMTGTSIKEIDNK